MADNAGKKTAPLSLDEQAVISLKWLFGGLARKATGQEKTRLTALNHVFSNAIDAALATGRVTPDIELSCKDVASRLSVIGPHCATMTHSLQIGKDLAEENGPVQAALTHILRSIP